MVTVLNAAGIALLVALLTGALFGYMVVDDATLVRHVALGLVAALGSILNLSLVMFYFIATGKAVREAAEKGLMPVKDYRITRKFKGKLFPLVMAAVVMFMITPVLGAGYHAGRMELTWHMTLAWSAIVFYAFLLFFVRKLLLKNLSIFEQTVKVVNAKL